jgi:hypothetical protein
MTRPLTAAQHTDRLAEAVAVLYSAHDFWKDDTEQPEPPRPTPPSEEEPTRPPRRDLRRARQLTALLVVLVLAAVAWVLLTDTEKASAYNHGPACRASLTGHGSDDDAGRFVSRIHAQAFLGFQMRANGAFVAWHGRDGSVWVRGYFGTFGGGFRSYRGHCWRGDYGPDRFVG